MYSHTGAWTRDTKITVPVFYIVPTKLSGRLCHTRIFPCLVEILPDFLSPLQAGWEIYFRTLSWSHTEPLNVTECEKGTVVPRFEIGALDALLTELSGSHCHTLTIKEDSEGLIDWTDVSFAVRACREGIFFYI